MYYAERLFKLLHERNAGQRAVARRYLFPFFQRLGFHVVGDHFYEIIPNTKEVAENYSKNPRLIDGIAWNLAEYEERGIDLLRRYGNDYLEHSTAFGFREDNVYFRGLDAIILYGLLRDRKPAQIVEVGQGYSTRVILAALDRNCEETGQKARFTSVDPYPRFRAGEIKARVELSVLEKKVQELDPDVLLQGADFLFIDSSHVFKFGSDVTYEFQKLYTRLPKNALLHVHDIFSPYDYPIDWMVKMRRFWNEQYFMECFLMYNSDFKIHLPLFYLYADSERFRAAVQAIKVPEEFYLGAGSFYVQRVAGD